jgi:hypothetical protein
LHGAFLQLGGCLPAVPFLFFEKNFGVEKTNRFAGENQLVRIWFQHPAFVFVLLL